VSAFSGHDARVPSTKPKKPVAKAAKKKPAAPAAAAKKTPAVKPAKMHGPRADLGAPVDGWFAKRPAAQRPIVDALRALVAEAAPDATSSIKWGMPFYTLGKSGMMCAIGAHKAHVNLILSGPPGTFADPDGRLIGDGKTGKHLKLTSLDDLPPRAQVLGWLRTAARRARAA
jgi:hypothetical protein